MYGKHEEYLEPVNITVSKDKFVKDFRRLRVEATVCKVTHSSINDCVLGGIDSPAFFFSYAIVKRKEYFYLIYVIISCISFLLKTHWHIICIKKIIFRISA